MKKLFWLMMALPIVVWAVPKPMESIENYNVLMVHGAYGKGQGFVDKQVKYESPDEKMDYFPEAYNEQDYLGKATLGAYHSKNRITRWLSEKVFEQKISEKASENAHDLYVYHWRSFANPANSSHNNAFELGDRQWCLQGTNFKKRRALVEEAQEVKAGYISGSDTLHGQDALDSIRQNPDLYHQLASRYILVGHSMGGVASREYVQGNVICTKFYVI